MTVIQQTVTDTLQNEGMPQKVVAKQAGFSDRTVSLHINERFGEKKRREVKLIPEFGRDSHGVDYGVSLF